MRSIDSHPRALAVALACSLVLGGCAHVETGRSSPSEPVTSAGGPPAAPPDAGAPSPQDAASADVRIEVDATSAPLPPLIVVRPGAPVDRRCPMSIDRPELVVANVGRTRITACDVALEWHRRTRAGLRVDDARTLVDALIRETLLSTRAPMPLPQDADIARELADALIRREASASMEPVDTSDEALARYAEAHRGQFVRDARLHLRAMVFATREEALAGLASLAGGTPLAELALASRDRTLRRDLGDLGLNLIEGAGALPAAVREAALALTSDGARVAEPVEVRTVGRRGGRRGASSSTWWVVERIARLEAANLPEALVRRRVAQRLLRERYRDALRAAEERLRATFAERARAAVATDGLRAMQIGAPR